MTGHGLNGIYFLTQGQTLTAEYYINNLLEKEVKPLLRRKKCEWSNRQAKIVQFQSPYDVCWRQGPSTRSQGQPSTVQENPPNFIEKTSWPPNSPDFNPVENLGAQWMKLSLKKQLLRQSRIWKDGSNKPGRKSHSPHYMTYPLHAATATEWDNKQRRTCQMLTFWIHVLNKEINILKKCRVEV